MCQTVKISVSLYLSDFSLLSFCDEEKVTSYCVYIKQDCVFTINLQNTRFSEGDTFALPVTVKDYSRRFIVTSANYPAYELPIGRVTVLVSIRNKNLQKK